MGKLLHQISFFSVPINFWHEIALFHCNPIDANNGRPMRSN